MKNSHVLDLVLSFNAFTAVIQGFKRFPLIRPLQYLLAPITKLATLSAAERATRKVVGNRIDRRGKTEHIDFFQYILPDDSPDPANKSELTHLSAIAVQAMFAGFGPMSDWFYSTLFCIFQEPESYKILVNEIRNTFQSYEDISPKTAAGLPYLNACLEESLRLMQSNNTGLPRYSPGAVVDGHYIPKGTTVQTSVFALGRSPRFFHDPFEFRPQCWLL